MFPGHWSFQACLLLRRLISQVFVGKQILCLPEHGDFTGVCSSPRQGADLLTDIPRWPSSSLVVLPENGDPSSKEHRMLWFWLDTLECFQNKSRAEITLEPGLHQNMSWNWESVTQGWVFISQIDPSVIKKSDVCNLCKWVSDPWLHFTFKKMIYLFIYF